MKKFTSKFSYLITALALLFVASGQVWGATATTVYYAVPSATVGSYTVKLNVNFKGNDYDWHQWDMELEDYTYDGKLVYSCSFTDGYDGLGCIQFQLYDGETWKSQQQPFGDKDWTSPNVYNGKIYIHDIAGWNTFGKDITIYAIPEAEEYDLSPAFDTEAYMLLANVKVGSTGDGEWLSSWPIFEQTDYKYDGKWIYKATVWAKYNVIVEMQLHEQDKGGSASHDYYDYNPASEVSADDIDGKIFGGWVEDEHTWYDYATDITLNQQSGSGGTSSVTATVGSAMPAATMPKRAGYAFDGYFSEEDGGGDQYYNADGSSATNWVKDGPTILYAKWIAVTTVPDDPDLDACQVTGLFGLSSFACQGLDGRCEGATETIGSKDTRHIYGITGGDFFTNDLTAPSAPARDYVHFEVWAAEEFTFTLELAGYNSGFVYSGTKDFTTEAGDWAVFDVELSDFTNYDDCFEGVFTGFKLTNLDNKDIWFANVYLYTESSACAAEPEDAPSAPTYSACQVQSIYSDTYASVGMSYADWGTGSSKADRTVDETNMYKVTVNNGNLGGLIINGKIDASSYGYIHMDVWTPLASTFRFSPICWNYTSSGNETEKYKADIATTAATWTSVDIPVSYFTDLGLTMRGNYQLKIDQCTSMYFWITNIYYYNTSSCPSYTPTAGTHHFGTAQRQNVALYSDADMATSRHANTNKPLAQRFDYYIVDCGEQMLSKVVTRGKLGTGVYDQMVQVWNNAKSAYQENKLSQHNAAATIGFQRIGDADQYKWNSQTTTAPMNFYMNFQEQSTALGYSEFFDYKRGYINNPNSDATAPTLTSVAKTSETNWFTLTFTGGNDNSGQWFYYIEDTDFDYYKVSLEDTIRIPKVDNGQVFHFNCYAVDFNGNMSTAKTITIDMPYTSPSTTNLALKRPVEMGITAGTGYVSGTDYTLANDGSLSTRWEEGDHGDAPYDYTKEWWYVDLRGYYALDSIRIWFETASTDNYVLQTCETLPTPDNDDTQWRTVYTGTSAPNTGNTFANRNVYDIRGAVARYVRIKSYNNTYAGGKYGFSMYEFEVYGSEAVAKDATAPSVSTASVSAIANSDDLQLTLVASDGSKVFRITDSSDNVYVVTTDASDHVVMDNIDYTYCTTYTFSVQAMDAAANLSSGTECSGSVEPAANFDLVHLPEGAATVTVSGQAGDPWQAAYAIDGDDDSYWAGRNSSGESTGEQWININLGRVFGVSSVKVAWNDDHASHLYIEGSRDGSDYYELKHLTTAPTNYAAAGNAIVYETYTLESHIRVRHIRLRAVDLTGEMAIRDLQIFGSCNDDYAYPVMTGASIKSIDCSNTGASARINVSAFDETTASGSITFKAVFTTGGLSDQTGLTATDGVITVTGMTEGEEYALRIYAYDGTGYSENYKTISSFTPRVSLYYLTEDVTGPGVAWENVLGSDNEDKASQRRFSTTATSGVYSFSITASTADVQYRLYYDVEGDITYRNNSDHWSGSDNQHAVGHKDETIKVYAQDKDHFVSNFDELYVYGAALNKATEGDAVLMSYSANKFTWEGPVATGTKAFRIIVKNNGSSFTDHSRSRIMDAAANYDNSDGLRYAKLTFDMTTWEYEWSGSDAGTYVFDNNSGSGDGNWSTASNWQNKAVPTIDKDVIITKPVTVDIAHATAKSIVLDQNENTGKLTIAANKGLEVTGTITRTTDGSNSLATRAEDLILESASAGNASLIFNNSNECQATVQMYSIGDIIDANTWNWQFMGTPFTSASALYSYYGSYLYEWPADGSTWTAVANGGTMTPFTGYCITQDDPTTYVMDGTLNPTTSKTLTVPGGVEMVFANSWSAPIDVGSFTNETFGIDVKTVYLFNTGFTPKNPAEAGTGAGTYIAVPIYSSPWTGHELIAPMQGFYVDNRGKSAGTITMDYATVVRPSGSRDDRDIVAGPMHAPKRVAAENEPAVMKIKATGSRYSERIVILEREDFSTGFDNGWDGKNLNEPGVAPILYALRADGTKDAVSAIPAYEGTVVGFRKGEDNEYTFSFEYDGSEVLYLNDLKKQKSTLINAEHTYVFTTVADDAEARFIISATPIGAVVTGIESPAVSGQSSEVLKVLIEDQIYIIRAGRMYNAIGSIVK